MSRCTDCAQFPCECGIQVSKCTCKSTYAVTFCKDCGIGMTTDHDFKYVWYIIKLWVKGKLPKKREEYDY